MQLLTKRYIVFRGITIGCLQLSTISCRHKKSGNPVKSRLPMQIKEARDGARGPGDLGLRGPERSVDIELSSPGRARKKERYRFGIVLFSSARRGSKPFPPLQGFSNGLPVETLQRGEVDPSASLAIMFLSCQKLGSRRRRQYYPQLLRHETLYQIGRASCRERV